MTDKITITKQTIIVKPRILKSRWTIKDVPAAKLLKPISEMTEEEQADLIIEKLKKTNVERMAEVIHGIDVEREIMEALSAQIATEIDDEIFKKLSKEFKK